MTGCPLRILQTGPGEVVPWWRRALGGSPGRRAVARLGQSPPTPGHHPTWAPRPRSPWSGPGRAVLPADSAALFQAWRGLRPGEDCGSFCAEKPQITPATGPDKASAAGSLPDKPCRSHQPQGPGGPRGSQRPALPGLRPPLPEAGPGGQPLSQLQPLVREEDHGCPGMRLSPRNAGPWLLGSCGGRGRGLEPLLRAPQMAS